MTLKLMRVTHKWTCPLCGFQASATTATSTVAGREEHLLFHLLTDPPKA
jgi:hypothetical protein